MAAQTVPQFISFTSGHVVDVLPLPWANIVGAVAAVERVAQSKKLAKAQIQMLFERVTFLSFSFFFGEIHV